MAYGATLFGFAIVECAAAPLPDDADLAIRAVDPGDRACERRAVPRRVARAGAGARRAAGVRRPRRQRLRTAPARVARARRKMRHWDLPPLPIGIRPCSTKTRNRAPSSSYLDQYVIGQDDAKKIVAVAVYSHFRRSTRRGDAEMPHRQEQHPARRAPRAPARRCCAKRCRASSAFPSSPPRRRRSRRPATSTRRSRPSCSGSSTRLTATSPRRETGIVFIDEIDKLKSADRRSRAASPAKACSTRC